MKFKTIIIMLLLSCLVSCDRLNLANSFQGDRQSESLVLATSSNLRETTAPKSVRQLSQQLWSDRPQVKIIAPQAGQTFERADVMVEIAVENFKLFRDDRLNLGNHLNLIVDNEPLREIYNVEEPIIIKDLAPGTHTLRVLAVHPWGESIKTAPAYAQTRFNVLTETQANLPNSDYPLLTYSSPSGTYGAEPILLDFYLQDSEGEINSEGKFTDYSIRATVNGTSFTIDSWQPHYLQGFEPGDNWVQLELIDKSGNPIENAFNNTVRVFNYNPQQEDALARLVTNQISFDDVRSAINQDDSDSSVPVPAALDSAPPSELAASKSIPPEPETELETDLSKVETPDLHDLNAKIESQELDSIVELENISSPTEESQESELNNDSLKTTEPAATETFEVVAPEPSSSLNSESEATELAAIDLSTAEEIEPVLEPEVEPAPKIVVSPVDSLREPVAEITMTQPESLKIADSEIDIAMPENPSQTITDEPQPESPINLWGKKILVAIRQAIEAIANKLPSEV
ncbi:MAG: hypothetical protein AAFQ41_08635 [Cyanobacteria bacterium J06623_7]